MRLVFCGLLLLFPGSVCFSQDTRLPESAAGLTEDNSRFEELATRYHALQDQFYAHEPREGADALKRFLEEHPMNTMVGDFLTLEEQSRGSDVGFSCLYHLALAAHSVSDAEYPVTRGKVAALKILGQHYYEHPDIDTTFRYLFSGARIVESKVFLRELIRSSPHSHVRANAMFELANYLALEANRPLCVNHTSRWWIGTIQRMKLA